MTLDKVEEWDLFKCLSCKDEPEFTPEELKEHLKSVHKVTEAKGTRKMLMHLDGTDFFQTDYEWQIGEVKLVQQVRCKRSEEDMAYWR